MEPHIKTFPFFSSLSSLQRLFRETTLDNYFPLQYRPSKHMASEDFFFQQNIMNIHFVILLLDLYQENSE